MRESMRRLASDEREGREGRAAGHRRVQVELLAGELIHVELPRKAKGAELLDKVCEELGILETDYFGLLHAQRGDPRVWVDLNRRLAKTFKNEPWEVRFAVKFYPPEPAQIQDDITRDHVQLAVRRDLMEGRLQCSQVTHALLASLVLQAELGDMESRVSSADLLRFHAAPSRVIDDQLEQRVQELYEKQKGQSPAAAVLSYLTTASKLPLYGAELHTARDAAAADILLAVAAPGVCVYRDGILLNRFPWAKILKISFNKRAFTLKLRPSEFEEWETSLTFHLASTTACKKLWRSSVEHHMFFRRAEPVRVSLVPALGLGVRRLSCRRTLRQMRAMPNLATAVA